MDFLSMNLPPEENDKDKNLDYFFDFMNNQMKKIEESDQKYKINNLLLGNDITPCK